MQLINHGEEALAFPGTTLYKLENALKAIGREPHSVIGSSNLGASVIGGINNNSGGALIQRGPAYTEQALYAQIDEHDELRLVNHLGIALGDTPEEIITNLENRNFNIDNVPHSRTRVGHNRDYEARVRDIDSDTPTRYNADPNELYEVSGASGKLAAFAVRLDTFPKEGASKVFYIGTNNPDVLERLRDGQEIWKRFFDCHWNAWYQCFALSIWHESNDWAHLGSHSNVQAILPWPCFATHGPTLP